MPKGVLPELLIDKSEINEEMRLIKNSDTYYITPSAKIYKEYPNNKYYLKSLMLNKCTGYLQVNLLMKDGTHKTKRVHRLLAETYIPNPNNYSVVGHWDNNKTHNTLDNLYWTTTQENTKKAYDDGLMIDLKPYTEKPIIMFNTYTNEVIKEYSSITNASKDTGIHYKSITHHLKNKSWVTTPYYFRFKDDENLSPPPIIIQYDLKTHNEIGRFLSSKDAERKTGINYRTILDQCKLNKPPQWSKSNTYFLYANKEVS